MLPLNENTSVTKNADGVIVVDGKAYPMANALVATEAQIHQRIKAVAKQLSTDYKHLSHRDTHTNPTCTNPAPISDDNPLIILSILKGSYIFTADMVRYLGDYDLPHVVDFVRLASYGGKTKSSGNVQLLSAARFENLRGKHILILEDIADSGRTLHYFAEMVRQTYQPASVRTCVLADKPKGRVVTFRPEYVCLSVPNEWVIGYGFEVNDRYRNLRHIFTLKKSEEKRYPSKL